MFRLPLCGLVLSVLTCIVYWAGLYGGFVFDDHVNILDNEKLRISSLSWSQLAAAATSISSGPLARPISMVSFALNVLTTDLSPFYFKLTNLIIHLLVGASIYWLTSLLLNTATVLSSGINSQNRAWLALATTGAWLLHPFNLTSVLYVVQRMTSLSALFCVWGMILYVLGRLRLNGGQSGLHFIFSGLIICGPLAVFSKENGALLPFFFVLIEWIFFQFSVPENKFRKLVFGFHILFFALPLLITVVFSLFYFDWLLGSYFRRDFTLTERLLTEARVLWFYLGQIVFPALNQMGIYHDDIAISRGLFNPATTLPSILGIGALIISAFAVRRRAPILSFGILFFFAGHLLESTVVGLEVAHEHRNYLPAYGIVFAIFFHLLNPPKYITSLQRVGPVFAALLVLMFGISTAVRANYWGNDIERAALDVQHHPQSARSRIELAYTYALFADYAKEPAKYREAARNQYVEAIRYDRTSLTAQFAVLALDSKSEVPPDPTLLSEVRRRLAESPLASASINALIKLSGCQTQGICHLAPEVVWQFFESALQNETLAGFARSQILTEMTQQKASAGELDQAIVYAEKAVINYPTDPQFHLNYASLLIAMNQVQTAKAEIALARRYDTNGFFGDRIARQEQLATENPIP